MSWALLPSIALALWACSEPAGGETPDAEAVSAPYFLVEVDGVELIFLTDSLTILGVTGRLNWGTANLDRTGTWTLTFSLRTDSTDVIVQEAGTFSVTRTNPQRPCGANTCEVMFVGSAGSFTGTHAGGHLLIELDGYELNFEDTRV